MYKLQRGKSKSLYSDIISRRNFEDFCSATNLVLPDKIKCFAANIAVLNLDKTNIVIFIKKNSSHCILQTETSLVV